MSNFNNDTEGEREGDIGIERDGERKRESEKESIAPASRPTAIIYLPVFRYSGEVWLNTLALHQREGGRAMQGEQERERTFVCEIEWRGKREGERER